MKSVVLSILAVVGVVAAVIGSLFGLGVLDLERRKFFEPRHAAVDREVFEQTPSYVHGKATYLTRLRGEYEVADTESRRRGLRTVILHEASTVDASLLPADLAVFIQRIR